MEPLHEESFEDEDDLQVAIEEKCNEVVELQAELRAAKIESDKLRLRLQAISTGPGRQMAHLPCPEPIVTSATADQSGGGTSSDLRNLILWLAARVNFHEPPTFLDVHLEVLVGNRVAYLGRVAQWQVSGSLLKLSAPEVLVDQVIAMLSAASASTSSLMAQPMEIALANFAAQWDFVPGELSFVRADRAVLLASRTSDEGILLARWPGPEALEIFRALHGTEGVVPRRDDRVYVEYQGTWYAGTVNAVDPTGKASVRCDVDAPGVLTIAPLHRVKFLRPVSKTCSALARSAQPTFPKPEAPSDMDTLSHNAVKAASGSEAESAWHHRRTRSAA